jgi:hypothetical protein
MLKFLIGLWISSEKSMVKSAYLRLWGVLKVEIPPTPLKKGGTGTVVEVKRFIHPQAEAWGYT